MKRLLLLLLALLLVACAGRVSKPANPQEEVVVLFLEALTTGKYDEANKYVNDELSITKDDMYGMSLLSTTYANVSLLSQDGEEAIVSVTITGKDFDKVIEMAEKTTPPRDPEMSRYERQALVRDSVNKAFAATEETKSATISITLVFEDDRWFVDGNDELLTGLFVGLIDSKVFEGMRWN